MPPTPSPGPAFSAFLGVRYDPDRFGPEAVTAPPYDVLSEDDRASFLDRDPHNAVRIDLPREEGGVDPYELAARLWNEWLDEGVLVIDDEPSMYVYRMGFSDEAGRPHQTTGVIGALALSRPGEGGILPHEHTTPKAKSDRLDLLRATHANLSPIWGLSPAAGLTALCEPSGPPDWAWTDDDGVHHRLWQIRQPGVLAAISEAVGSAPVLIADGHHRYETSLAYRDERRAVDGEHPDPHGGYDSTLAYVVELADEQLTVLPIHRLVAGLPDGTDVAALLEPFFEVTATDTGDDASLPSRMADAGALCLVTGDGRWLLRPRPEAMAGARDLDSSRLDVALAGLPEHELTYQHGVGHVVDAVESGRADAGVLLRPATVAQITAIAHGGERMPPKTTFFHPKPRTG
ncbi:MAG: DUF1015 domain-containing protein, partial [Acidimicrobiales bacterium]|nr:DUF1015 domain-containing protein [Acidimicrobiales bacterium]